MIANQFFWPYLAASIVCIASPGPDSLTVLSLGLARGRREAMQFALGVGSGCLTHTLWAALGVAAVVAASQQLFIAIKLAGAAYLLWLGISALRSRGALAAGRLPSLGAARAARGGWQRYLNGFVSNSLNPKVMLFFIAFLPQFVDPAAGPVSIQMLQLGAGFALMTATSYLLLGAASGRVGELLQRRPGLALALDRAVGVLFIGLAARLVLAEHA
ncbi:MAG: LysE family translocator [Quisquiliibacterium sp.]